MDVQKLVLQARADYRVHGTKRLIHEKQRGLGRERPSHADSLALPTGQLRWISIPDPRGIETNKLDELVDSAADLRLRPLQQPGDCGNVLSDGSMG
jgi:hypothetical protein